MNMDESGHSDMRTDQATDEEATDETVEPQSGQDLKPFADQLMAIARQLRDGEFASAAAHRRSQPNKDAPANTPPTHSEASDLRTKYADHARNVYDARRRRDAIFQNSELFGEPAWDILLDLYIAFANGKLVSVSSACIGSASPPTTGLRWLGVLADDGLVVREQDPGDQRRVLVRLTERGVDYMDQYFANAGNTR